MYDNNNLKNENKSNLLLKVNELDIHTNFKGTDKIKSKEIFLLLFFFIFYSFVFKKRKSEVGSTFLFFPSNKLLRFSPNFKCCVVTFNQIMNSTLLLQLKRTYL